MDRYFRTEHHLDVNGNLRRVRTFTLAAIEAEARCTSESSDRRRVAKVRRSLVRFSADASGPWRCVPKAIQVVL